MRTFPAAVALLLCWAVRGDAVEVLPTIPFDVRIQSASGSHAGVGRVIPVRRTDAEGVASTLYHVSVHDPQTLGFWHQYSRWKDAAEAIRDVIHTNTFVAGNGTLIAIQLGSDTLFVQRAKLHVKNPEDADRGILAAKTASPRATGLQIAGRVTSSMQWHLPSLFDEKFVDDDCGDRPRSFSVLGGSGNDGVWKLTLSNCRSERRDLEFEEVWTPIREAGTP